MKLFYTNAAAKEEIGKLEGQIDTLKSDAAANAAEITRLTSEVESIKTELASMTTERDEAAAAVSDMEAKSKTDAAEITRLTSELQSSNDRFARYDSDVETAAAARFAGLGGNPLPESGNGDNDKSELAGLTGLARATAIHKAQADARKK